MPNRSIKDTRSYGAPMGVTEPGQTTATRPAARAADPAVVRQKLAERAAEKEAPMQDQAPASPATAQTNSSMPPEPITTDPARNIRAAMVNRNDQLDADSQ